MKMLMQEGSSRVGVSLGIWVMSVWFYLATHRATAGSTFPIKIMQACGTITPPSNSTTFTSPDPQSNASKVLLFFLQSDKPPSQCHCSISPVPTASYIYRGDQLHGSGAVNIASKIDSKTRENKATSSPIPTSSDSSLSSSYSSPPTTPTTPSVALSTANVSGVTESEYQTSTMPNITSSLTQSPASSSIPSTPLTTTTSTKTTNITTTIGDHGGGDNSREDKRGGNGEWCKWKNDKDTGCLSQGGEGDVLMISLEGDEGSFVFLFVEANGSVSISCNNTQSTPPPTTPPATQTTHQKKTTDKPTSSAITTDSDAPKNHPSDDTTPSDNGDLTLKPGASERGAVKEDKNEESNGQSQLILAFGCALILIALIIACAAGWCFFDVRRKRLKLPDGLAETGSGKKKQRGIKASSSNGVSASGAGLNNSRVSLISEGGHNYEDMREDVVESLRKESNFSVTSTSQQQQQPPPRKKHSQPDNYSHIPSCRPPPPSTAGGGSDDDSNDDYNRLDLAPRVPKDACSKTSPAPLAAPKPCTSAAAAPKTFYVGDENSEYSEVRDEGDIYEAVDEAGQDDVYTDCVSSSDVRSSKGGDSGCTSGGKVNQAFDRKGLQEPGQNSSVVQHLPAFPLPAAMTKGLRRHKSRSVDISKVEALRYKAAATAASRSGGEREEGEKGSGKEGGGWKGHKHSRSADFNSSSTNPFLCDQRELFLENFRKQQAKEGGNDARVAGPRPQNTGARQRPVPAEYTDISVTVGQTDDTRVAGPRPQNTGARQRPVPAEYTDISVTVGQTGRNTLPPPTSSLPTAPNNNNDEKIDEAANIPPSTNPGAGTSPEAAAAAAEATPEPPVVLRRKTQRRSSKKKVNSDNPPSMIAQLKEINTQLQEWETVVRRSMEIRDDEIIMIDNALYGTLPRNESLPTTEL